ncbi:MAG: ATP-dependent RNA helicase DbpA [Sulfuricurvum sp.]|jgi:ATP-independent RNA helicase DbpA|uniref:ATP-dependent RNA helicase DbpA n=1 Tax=Sulfuricurvum sp. TaxID=2025608 RepID=UPI0025F195C2|nr:ATP-dependent RNA helicase DbpA [Sulfuricurvum sp.]MCK9374354.1 ATP-dependent RNA helicase DbpA [Sulfuricurvum sp.]
MSSFDPLPLRAPLKTALKRLNFTAMTPIQSASLPMILEGKDIIAQASTGSGKTLAFALGILNKVNPKFFAPQAVVLCPTRELAEQVTKVIRSCASEIGNIKLLTLCGGVPMKGQIHSLTHGAHIIVGTPGRVLKLLSMNTLDLNACGTMVLDEADQMVDMGFIDDIEAIFGYLPTQRQTLLFSATYPDSIKTLSARLTHEAHFLKTQNTTAKPSITEVAYLVNDKLSALNIVMHHHAIVNAIIFCNTKIVAAELCETLNNRRIHAITLHGDMEQFHRNEAIIQFRNGSAPFLVATDVAGRGIDIEGLDAIINYDLPQQSDRYVHRIGRTGRAGMEGLAITLISPHQKESFIALQRPCEPIELPIAKGSKEVITPMRTICIDAGKKEKLRAGDIVGALIHEAALTKEQIGKIDQLDHLSYVALPRELAEKIYNKLKNRPIKGRIFRLWLLD